MLNFFLIAKYNLWWILSQIFKHFWNIKKKKLCYVNIGKKLIVNEICAYEYNKNSKLFYVVLLKYINFNILLVKQNLFY